MLYNSHYWYLSSFCSALVSGRLVSRSRGTVWLGLWVLSLTLVCNISNISSISVYSVGNLLQSAVRKSNIVTSAGGISISILVGTIVVWGVVVLGKNQRYSSCLKTWNVPAYLDRVWIRVLGRFIRVCLSRSTISWGSVWPGEAAGNQDCHGEKDLRSDIHRVNTTLDITHVTWPNIFNELWMMITFMLNMLSSDSDWPTLWCEGYL